MVAARNRILNARPSPSTGGDEAKSPAESVKETIDSIIIALALALVFRAFVVEAFVIPTGSMAPTLAGEHRYFVCTQCGYPIDVNVDTRQPQEQASPRPLYCPNCALKFESDDQLDIAKNPKHGGDKILVFKFPYLFDDPKRWDVVVFYNPANPDENFIKRLIGRPGETVQILDGNVFIGTVGGTDDEMEIQRKPPLVQQALWRPVYLNDFLPNSRARLGPARAIPRWMPMEPHSGWRDSDTRVFHYRPDKTAMVPDQLVFQPDNRKLGFLDYAPYNQYPENDSILNAVWDLKLEFAVFFQEAGGQVSASMNHRISERQASSELSPPLVLPEEQFTATFHQDGKVELFSTRSPDPKQPIATANVAPFPVGRGVVVALQDVDYLVTVFVDGRNVLEYDRVHRPGLTANAQQEEIKTLLALLRANEKLPPKKPADLADSDLPRVWIEGGDRPVDLSHVSLYRDVYYTTWMGQMSRILRGAPGVTGAPGTAPEEIVKLKKWSNDGRDNPDDEFFVMGDNSPASSDGRLWTFPDNNPKDTYWHLQKRIAAKEYRYGRVPRDHLIGQAFFVYWPAALRMAGSPVDLVPNVGRMRLIH